MDEKLLKLIADFNHARKWDKKHTEANLSKSIIIEASELLEHFQWDNKNYNKNEVCDELADVLIYCLSLCNLLEVKPTNIIQDKLEKVEKKYPVDL